MAAKVNPNKPIIISFTCKNESQISDGNTLKETVLQLNKFAPQLIGIGVNCTPPNFINQLIKIVKEYSKLKYIIVYPNSGEKWENESMSWGKTDLKCSLEEYREWIASGANIIGGCCRTTPKHIKELKGIQDEAK